MRRVLPLVLLASACGSEGTHQTSPPEPTRSGDVVARVRRGEVTLEIHRDELVRHATARGVDARTALTELEDEHLMAAEARRRGLPAGDLERRREQVLAQLVLRALEEDVPPTTVSEDEVQARLPGVEAAMRRPERRSAVHLLIAVDATPTGEETARNLAARAVALARAPRSEATDPVRWLEDVRTALLAEVPSASVRVERIPPFAADARYEAPFVAAVFGARGVGVLETPVRTGYGLHVIDVTEITPARIPTADEIERRARAELLEARRREALDRVLVAARDAIGLEVREAAITRFLDDDQLFEALR